jgi:hypothetical protein
MTHLELADGLESRFGRWIHKQENRAKNVVSNSPQARYARWLAKQAETGTGQILRTAQKLEKYVPAYQYAKGANYIIGQVQGKPTKLVWHNEKWLPLSDGLESRFGRYIRKSADKIGKTARQLSNSQIGKLIAQYGPDALSLIPGANEALVASKYLNKAKQGIGYVNKAKNAYNKVSGLTRMPVKVALPDTPDDSYMPPSANYPTAKRASAIKPTSVGFNASTLLPVAGGLAALYFLTRSSKK